MNMFHRRQLRPLPATLLNYEGDVEVLRPLIYCAEPDLANFAAQMAFRSFPVTFGSQEACNATP